MRRRSRLRRAAGLSGGLVLLLSACGEAPAPTASPAPAPAFPVVQLAPVTVPEERLLDGLVEPVREATVAAETSGRVAEINYDVNDVVPAGAVLLKIRSTEQRASLAQAEATLTEAEARDAEARSRYGRIEGMYQRQVVSRAQYDQAVAERDAAGARLTAARAAVAQAREGLDYTEIRAPYAGIVTERLVRVGETVTPGTPLMRGFSAEALRVVVDLPQALAGPARRLKQAVVYRDGERVPAASITLFPAADAASGTVRARLALPPGGPMPTPGTYVSVGIVIGETTALLVPVSAVVTRSEVTGVYVLGTDNRVGLRQVRLGRRLPGTEGQPVRVVVLAGLAAGDRIALDPLAAARAAAQPASAP